jgi:hypothetical protein
MFDIVEFLHLQKFANGYSQKKNIAQAIFMDSGSWFTIENQRKKFLAGIFFADFLIVMN